VNIYQYGSVEARGKTHCCTHFPRVAFRWIVDFVFA